MAAATFTGCGAPEPERPPDLILISLDTLRADRVGCHSGSDRTDSLTPGLDALCAEGTRYERAIANSPWTLPSHVSMLTGRYPRNHGVKNVGKQVPGDIPLLPELLARKGYATAAILGSPKLGRRYGLERGFRQGFEHPPSAGRAAPLQVEQALGWIRRQREADTPYFLFLHNFDIHTDYDAAPRFRDGLVEPYDGAQRGSGRELLAVRNARTPLAPDDVRHLSQLYDAGIRELDHDLAPLLAFLHESGVADDTVVFVTSDHGEEFWEHGSVLHGVTMYRETLHVPLIAWGRGVPRGERRDDLVQLSDLAPTMLELAGVAAPPGLDGRSLVPTWRGETLGDRHAYAEADWRGEQLDTFRMIRDGRHKLILDRITGRTELYDLARDPHEQYDVADAHPAVVARLLEALRSYMATESEAPDRPPLSAEEEETLRALGYIE